MNTQCGTLSFTDFSCLEIAAVAVFLNSKMFFTGDGCWLKCYIVLLCFPCKHADKFNFWLWKVWIVVLHNNSVKLKTIEAFENQLLNLKLPTLRPIRSPKQAHCSVTVHCTDSPSSAASSRVKTETGEQNKAENSKIVYSRPDFMNTQRYFEPHYAKRQPPQCQRFARNANRN